MLHGFLEFVDDLEDDVLDFLGLVGGEHLQLDHYFEAAEVHLVESVVELLGLLGFEEALDGLDDPCLDLGDLGGCHAVIQGYTVQ